jgi:hypothetical protein
MSKDLPTLDSMHAPENEIEHVQEQRVNDGNLMVCLFKSRRLAVGMRLPLSAPPKLSLIPCA